jgi:hypothetical protein
MATAPPLGELNDEIVRSQTDRILASDFFREAPVQRKLLRFLVDETLAGNAQNLKEYVLGTTVFQRGEGFDPRTDSIVRVQIGVLRKKLASYYGGPGTEDRILIVVPRGHYFPKFTALPPREIADVTLPAQAAVEPAARIARERSWTKLVYLFAGLAAGVALMFAVFAWWSPARTPEAAPAAFEWRDHPIWKGFFEPGATTKLVVGVPLMFGYENLLVRDPDVNAPEDYALNARLRRLEKNLGTHGEPREVYTGLGEAAGIQVLERFFWSAARDLPLVRNRLVRWQDVTSGNLIFVSSFRFRTLKQEMDLPSDFEYDGVKGVLRNLHPGPGEPKEYKQEMATGSAGTDYALVSVWPGTLPGRRIMMAGGAHTWGTQGAVEYITDAPSLKDLRARLTPGAPSQPLQLILKVQVKDAQPIAVELVTHHWISVGPPAAGKAGS